MPQFFVDEELTVGTEVTLRGADARHVASSLRLVAGDWIVLADATGRQFRTTIIAATPSSVCVQVDHLLPARKGPSPPILALAIIKADRFEWALQKVVELGCRRILPFTSQRTSAVVPDTRKLARWQRIAVEAAKQSGLPVPPTIEATIDFDTLCERGGARDRAILFYEGEQTRGLKEILTDACDEPAGEALIIVGPEGGFTPEEVDRAHEAEIITVGLGPQILRVETAAIAAMAIWQYATGNMNP